MYEKFRKANPSFQSRIEAFTSGILSPDIKGLTLQSMNPLKTYTRSELYDQVCAFCGFDSDLRTFPLTPDSIWSYYNGRPRYRGCLDSIGVVVKLNVGVKDTPHGIVYATAYHKTDAGEDFGNPLVARGTYVVNELAKRRIKNSSLWKLLGAFNKNTVARYRSGYTRYKIIKFLSEHPKEEFRKTDLVQALPELDDIVISDTLNSLGEAGVIDYYSSRGSGWSEYTLVKKLNEEEIVSNAMKIMPQFRNIGYLRSVIGYVNKNSNEVFKYDKLSEKLGIRKNQVSACLSIMHSTGYLSAKLKGKEIMSIAKANEITQIVEEELIEPIERISYNLNPNISGFRNRFDYYLEHKEEWKEARKTHVKVYDEERTQLGPPGGKELRSFIVSVLYNKDKMKITQVREEVKNLRRKNVGGNTILLQLRNLENQGKVKRLSKSYYALI